MSFCWIQNDKKRNFFKSYWGISYVSWVKIPGRFILTRETRTILIIWFKAFSKIFVFFIDIVASLHCRKNVMKRCNCFLEWNNLYFSSTRYWSLLNRIFIPHIKTHSIFLELPDSYLLWRCPLILLKWLAFHSPVINKKHCIYICCLRKLFDYLYVWIGFPEWNNSPCHLFFFQ